MSTLFGVVKGDLIASLGELVHSGTASSGTASTLVDSASLSFPDDYFNNHRIYIYAGIGVGQERRITDSDQSSMNVTISPDWGTNPDNTSKYYIYRQRFNNAAYEAAFKQALRLLRSEFLLVEEGAADLGDPALAATYDIDVPAGLVTIREIWREHATLDDHFPHYWPGPGDSISPFWTIHGEAGARKIKIDKVRADANGQVVEGRAIRVVGQKFETEPTADTSSLTINTAWVIELAALLLSAREVADAAERTNLAYIFTSRLTEIVRRRGRGPLQGSVIVEDL